MFDTQSGQTHSENDGCGITEHNQPQENWEERFDKKFGDKEGCQKYGEDCGKKVQPSDNFLCSVCEKWGGVDGKVKDWKRPLATLKQIKSFIRQLLEEARQQERQAVEERVRGEAIKAIQEAVKDTEKEHGSPNVFIDMVGETAIEILNNIKAKQKIMLLSKKK